MKSEIPKIPAKIARRFIANGESEVPVFGNWAFSGFDFWSVDWTFSGWTGFGAGSGFGIGFRSEERRVGKEC